MTVNLIVGGSGTAGPFQKVYASLIDNSNNLIKGTRKRENQNGSAGTGIDGAVNRVYTLVETLDLEIVEVFLDGVLLNEASQYTVDNTLKTITVLIAVWNTQVLAVFYYV